jgi:hypothetical protein
MYQKYGSKIVKKGVKNVSKKWWNLVLKNYKIYDWKIVQKVSKMCQNLTCFGVTTTWQKWQKLQLLQKHQNVTKCHKCAKLCQKVLIWILCKSLCPKNVQKVSKVSKMCNFVKKCQKIGITKMQKQANSQGRPVLLCISIG